MANASGFQFAPIGFIESCYKERFGTPRQPHLAPDSWAILRLRPELNLATALDGLEGFSHLWLVFVFHANTNNPNALKNKVHPPRLGGESMGLFATRTPHRPNPIGLSVVRLEKVDGVALHLSGVDLIDGTPVLDIKPYMPESDSRPIARVGWTCGARSSELQVRFSDEGRRALEARTKDRTPEGRERLRRLIEQTLRLDPRPNFYKGSADRPNPYTDVYGFFLENFNIVYRMADNEATILDIELQSEYSAPPKERRP